MPTNFELALESLLSGRQSTRSDAGAVPFGGQVRFERGVRDRLVSGLSGASLQLPEIQETTAAGRSNRGQPEPEVADVQPTDLRPAPGEEPVLQTAGPELVSPRGSLVPLSGSEGFTTQFDNGVSLDVSPAMSGGFSITNPFADDSLSPQQQQQRSAEEIQQIQRVVSRERRKRLEETFRAKWQRARRVLPTMPRQAQQQVLQQMQGELAQLNDSDPLDLFDIHAAEESPEVKLTQFRDNIREAASALYGDEALADKISKAYVLNDDGGINAEYAQPLIKFAEAQKQSEVKHRQARELEEFRADRSRNESLDNLRQFAEGVLTSEKFKDLPEARAGIMARVREYQAKFGPLPGPVPAQLTLPGIYEWLYPLSRTRPNAGAQPTQVRPQAVNVGGRQLRVVQTVEVQSDADILRAKEELDRIRANGQPNATFRIILPNGMGVKTLP